MQAFRQWVADEHKDKQGKEVDTSAWAIRCAALPSACLPSFASCAGLQITRTMQQCVANELKDKLTKDIDTSARAIACTACSWGLLADT